MKDLSHFVIHTWCRSGSPCAYESWKWCVAQYRVNMANYAIPLQSSVINRQQLYWQVFNGEFTNDTVIVLRLDRFTALWWSILHISKQWNTFLCSTPAESQRDKNPDFVGRALFLLFFNPPQSSTICHNPYSIFPGSHFKCDWVHFVCFILFALAQIHLTHVKLQRKSNVTCFVSPFNVVIVISTKIFHQCHCAVPVSMCLFLLRLMPTSKHCAHPKRLRTLI